MKKYLFYLPFLLTALLLYGPANWSPGQIPGDPSLPFGPVTVNLHWQVHTHGFSSYIADDLHGYPYRSDRMVTDGVPVDAVTSSPFCLALGTPVGFWIWLLLVITAQGAFAGWLGSRWWGRWEAGLIGGVGYQVAEAGLREVGDGRYATAFSAALLPAILALALEKQAVLSAIGVGLVALTDPSLAMPALFLGLVAQRGSRPNFLAALGTTIGIPLAWILSGLGELPSMSMDPWSPALIDFAQQTPVDLVASRIYGWGGVMMGTLLRPVLWAVAGLVCLRGPPSRWRGPALWALIGALFGLGPSLPGPVVLPAGWLLELPLLSRAWWSDRWWLVPGLLGPLLAGGFRMEMLRRPPGLDRWASVGIAVLLLIEARLLSHSLPFRSIPLPPADSAKVLANFPDLPMVLLPLPGGRFRSDRFDLLDQLTHGRPLAQGIRPPFDLTAPDALLRSWQQNAGLRALAACETGQPSAVTGRETADLLHAGLRVVYVDRRYVLQNQQAQGWLDCVKGVLKGWELGKEQEPFLRFEGSLTVGG